MTSKDDLPIILKCVYFDNIIKGKASVYPAFYLCLKQIYFLYHNVNGERRNEHVFTKYHRYV